MEKMVVPRRGPSTRSLLAKVSVCILLAAITWGVFGQTLHHEFVNFDDPKYVLKNPEIRSGLSFHGLIWAFTHSHSYNWHPLTTLSHMMDCQLYGLNAGGHHLTNVLLHAAAVFVLFLVLQEITGALWRSAFVAALFAIHPLRAESVAWIAERKDVLSGLFFMLTLAAYVGYVRKPSLGKYLLVVFVFVLGLMSKSMLVTVPFVLLLLDYWPLRRFPHPAAEGTNTKVGWRSIPPRVILEKFPLLFFSALSCVATVLVQTHSIRTFPVPLRVYNALKSYAVYISQLFWPTRLAVFYPYPSGSLSIWPALLSLIFLLGMTFACWNLRKQKPYLITGWLWYLGMLVPVIGLLQVGTQSHADRYTYLPHIGLFMIAAWGLYDLSRSWRYQREILGVLGVVVIVVLAWQARLQTSFWKNSERLWTQTLAVTSSNAFAHENLGYLLLDKGQLDNAISQFQMALKIRPDPGRDRIDPDNAHVHTSLGTALIRKNLLADGLAHYEESLTGDPKSVVTLNNLALILSISADVRFRNGARAVQLAEKADRLSDQRDANVVRTLAAAYAEDGRFSDALNATERALNLANAQGDTVMAGNLRLELDLYRLNLPRRDKL
jgi:tetratricopeptide (TPR) repeat protein